MFISVEVGVPGHRKTRRAVVGLGLLEGDLTNQLRLSPEVTVLGMLVSLWINTRLTAPDGDLEGWTERDVAAACGVVGAPAGVTAALLAAGLLDRGPHGLVVHDWMDWNGKHLREAERQRLRREGKRGKQGAAGDLFSVSPSSQSSPTVRPPNVPAERTDVPCTPAVRPARARVAPRASVQAPEPQARAGGAAHVGGVLGALMDTLRAASASAASASVAVAPEPEDRFKAIMLACEPHGLTKAQVAHAARITHRLLAAGVGVRVARAVLEVYCARADAIRNPFAYFNPKSAAFADMREQLSARLSELDGDEAKRLEVAFATAVRTKGGTGVEPAAVQHGA